MRVLCISGKAQHGKDTSANILQGFLEDSGAKVKIIHYADLLKFICKSWFDWDGAKDDYGRTLLQRVGTDTVRAKEPDYWVAFVCNFLKLFPDEWDYVIIPDCRFPNEVNMMKANFDTIHLRVNRPNFNSPLTEEQQKHISETALDHVAPDLWIENTGTKSDLRSYIIHLLKDIKVS
jgi:hypothetical protein